MVYQWPLSHGNIDPLLVYQLTIIIMYSYVVILNIELLFAVLCLIMSSGSLHGVRF